MRILEFVGIAIAAVGAAMLVLPGFGGVGRWLLRTGLGVPLNPHPASRVGAWGLLLLGVAVVFLARLAA